MNGADLAAIITRYKQTCVTRTSFDVRQEGNVWRVTALIRYFEATEKTFKTHMFVEQRVASFADINKVGVYLVEVADECAVYPANIEARVKEQY